MAEALSKLRTGRSGDDLLWKSEMRRTRRKTGDAMGRTSWRRRPRPKIPRKPGYAERKLKLQQVCPRKLSHQRGSPHKLGTTWEQNSPNAR